MKVNIVNSYEEMGEKAALAIATKVKENPACVLGLPTGTTPLSVYKSLINKYKSGEISFKDVTTFNLDEYYGLSPEHPQSYRHFMNENFFNHIDIDKNNTNVPNGAALDIEAFCKSYENKIHNSGGLDIQLLGIGHNGHIGFNEPSDSFDVYTHKVKLADKTIEMNSRLFSSREDVPVEAVTMGIGTIMRAKQIILVASGEDKADIVEKMIHGKVTPKIPASILQFHNDVTVYWYRR